jgi:hypothetical protein
MLNGYYSPKIDDQSWGRIFIDWIELKLQDVNIVGDGHYTWLMRNCESAHVYAPTPEPKKARGQDPSEEFGFGKLTKQQKEDNKALRSVRGGMESPFGWMKKNWAEMREPWAEEWDYHRATVFMLAGIHRYNRELVLVEREANGDDINEADWAERETDDSESE